MVRGPCTEVPWVPRVPAPPENCLPGSSSVSRPFSREPQTLGFLELPQISNLASAEGRAPGTVALAHQAHSHAATAPG